jgi:hypothetical protein
LVEVVLSVVDGFCEAGEGRSFFDRAVAGSGLGVVAGVELRRDEDDFVILFRDNRCAAVDAVVDEAA